MRKFDPANYAYYVKKYMDESLKYGKPISHPMLRKQPFNLPDARWYVVHCPDESVKTWADFVDWCGFVAKRYTPSKEKMIFLIYRLSYILNRPLMYDDFRGVGCYHPPIDVIREYWGSINNMKKELGLEIIQESMMDRSLSKDDFDKEVVEIIEYIKSDGRNFIASKDIDENKNWLNYNSLNKLAQKYYGRKLSDILQDHDIYFGKAGRGISFTFPDGEKTTSRFEYIFSKYLRDSGLVYNKDYIRDVKYSTFIPGHTSHMNCDYLIHTSSGDVYIEIAGIIEAYKTWYYAGRKIENHKSKLKYQLKLYEKEKLLKDNNLKYFILFPCDLTVQNFSQILSNPSLELKHNIESFYKNNIDWLKIDAIGKLEYSDQIKWGHNVINY